ncbi:hypothetical protein Hamer_G019559 [Homarus americanus]|uniref:Uncharacterized protein n=1 Tax=Homarus americanus TaxID=6706 RepID=A0A8J5J7I2_HOMAM|nr:hypothetical protein Hamer_G019559 [Homarus americanus]
MVSVPPSQRYGNQVQSAYGNERSSSPRLPCYGNSKSPTLTFNRHGKQDMASEDNTLASLQRYGKCVPSSSTLQHHGNMSPRGDFAISNSPTAWQVLTSLASP